MVITFPVASLFVQNKILLYYLYFGCIVTSLWSGEGNDDMSNVSDVRLKKTTVDSLKRIRE